MKRIIRPVWGAEERTAPRGKEASETPQCINNCTLRESSGVMGEEGGSFRCPVADVFDVIALFAVLDESQLIVT